MQATQSLTTINRELIDAGIDPHDSMRRARIASAIRQTGAYFGPNEVLRLRAHFAVGYVGGAADEALREALLDGSWVAIAANAAANERPRQDPNEKTLDSHLRHCTESNPYGWQKPELQRGLDHDVPATWNSFRQSYNLTAAERTAANARDHRVRGCTRWEVLGRDGQPTVEHDAQVVKDALANEQVAAVERGVYGEAAP